MPSTPRTYTGALHIHTDRSDGGGTLDDVVTAARSNGIDFVVISDHNTRGYGIENMEGWHKDVLVLCAEEVMTPEGHLLAFETREDIGAVAKKAEAIEQIKRQYGTAVSLHHQLAEQKHCQTLGFGEADLVEIWSFMDDFLASASPKHVLQAAARPDKLLRGPSRKLLWQWDRELERRNLPIVGGLNVHQRKAPLLEWKMMFPYGVAFQTICTCIQTTELPSVSIRARDIVWSALRDGRSYVANRSIATEKGFQFEFRPNGGRARLMGEDAPFVTTGKFFVRVPQEAEVVLRHNGQPLFWGTAHELHFPAPSPGSYRVEVYLNRRLWILSNPIRLVDEEGIVQPTVSDIT